MSAKDARRKQDEHRHEVIAIEGGGLAVSRSCIESALGKSAHFPIETGAPRLPAKRGSMRLGVAQCR